MDTIAERIKEGLRMRDMIQADLVEKTGLPKFQLKWITLVLCQILKEYSKQAILNFVRNRNKGITLANVLTFL